MGGKVRTWCSDSSSEETYNIQDVEMGKEYKSGEGSNPTIMLS